MFGGYSGEQVLFKMQWCVQQDNNTLRDVLYIDDLTSSLNINVSSSITSIFDHQKKSRFWTNRKCPDELWSFFTSHFIPLTSCFFVFSGPHKHQSAVTCLQFNKNFVITSSDDGTVKLWDLKTGEFIRNLVTLESGGSGGVVWRIRASNTKLVCAVGSRNGTEETKLLVLDFDVDMK